jgi:hypothetical protein
MLQVCLTEIEFKCGPNAAIAVLPLSSRVAAIPDEAIAKADSISYCTLATCSQVTDNFPVSAGVSIKKYVSFIIEENKNTFSWWDKLCFCCVCLMQTHFPVAVEIVVVLLYPEMLDSSVGPIAYVTWNTITAQIVAQGCGSLTLTVSAFLAPTTLPRSDLSVLDIF